MDVVNIFLTSELGESLDDFVHDQRRFTFDRLGPNGPGGWSKGRCGPLSTG